jgi:spermidine synthase
MRAAPQRPPPARLLYVNVLLIASCGLVYELLAGTLGSYLLGDSVTQFSLVIGLYLSAMGFGAWISKHIEGNLARRFIEVELAISLVGGLSAPLLYVAFAEVQNFQLVLLGFVFAIGTLVGLELPLLMRIVQAQVNFKDLVSHVLTFDYAGALFASLLFPLVLVPKLGLMRSSLCVGLVNAAVALWGTWLLAADLPRVTGLRVRAGLVIVLLTVGLGQASQLTTWAESRVYADEIVFARSSAYQRILITQSRAGFQLFLNGNLQFAGADEYRYHEALVHPALLVAGAGAPGADGAGREAPERVLVLGGGDGLALREVLAHPVRAVTLVDLDPAMTELGRDFEPLAEQNRRALSDPRVHVINEDAMIWLETAPSGFDAAIVDFPDPNTFALGKLYTRRFFQLLARRLSPDAAVAVQATSPLFARKSYWCIVETMKSAGFFTRPYHVAVPSFGEWGFVLAKAGPFDPPRAPPLGVPLRFLNAAALASMFEFPADMGPLDVEINRLDNQRLVHYYEDEWRRWQ